MAHLQAKAEQGRIAAEAQAEEDGRRLLEFLQALKETLPNAGATTRPRAWPADYEVLEVTADATDEEVRQAHREKLRRNDPELLAQMDPELQAVATARTKMINMAMERLMRARGM
jgi:DnaJ-domain-containing protein 1